MAQRFCSCGMAVGISSKTCLLCKARIAKEKKDKNRAKRIDAAKEDGKVLVHSCLPTQFDPAHDCVCKQLVTVDEALALVKSNQAVDLESRQPVFANREILLIGIKKVTPRANTIEKANIERAFVTKKVRVKNERRLSPEQSTERDRLEFEILKRRIAADHLAKFEEERLRMDVWAEMQAEFYKDITIDVPTEEFDRRRERDFGRPGLFVTVDQRTEGGIGVDVMPRCTDRIALDDDADGEAEPQPEPDDERDPEEQRAA